MLRILCPAKLNLFLSVGPRDAKGYHPIRTIFQAIALYDELTIERVETDSFECNWSLPQNNTVTRTWSLLREVVPLPPLRVSLLKRIPSEAGLGGGSTDAAGLMRGVQKLLGLTIPPAELNSLALAIGADVPFFLLGGRARGEGYGEKLTPLPDPIETWAVLLKPSVGCSTVEMYQALDQKTYDWLVFPNSDELHNDFERVAPCECLDLIERLQADGAVRAGLTGSGSAVFGIVRDEGHAHQIAARYEQAFAVKFLSRKESSGILLNPQQ